MSRKLETIMKQGEICFIPGINALVVLRIKQRSYKEFKTSDYTQIPSDKCLCLLLIMKLGQTRCKTNRQCQYETIITIWNKQAMILFV